MARCRSRLRSGLHDGTVANDRIDSIHIVAIEAVPEKAERLRRKFPRTEVHACALGESEATVSFFVNVARSGYSSLYAESRDRSDRGVRQITVPMRRMDDLVRATGVDVIKIDVEGAELRVLQGSERLIARDRCVVMFESGPDTGSRRPRRWRGCCSGEPAAASGPKGGARPWSRWAGVSR